MAFKLISKDGDFLPMLNLMQREGAEVKAYIEEDVGKMYDGIVDQVDNVLELDIQPDDIVVFDMVGAGGAAERLKEKGYNVIGGGKLNDKLELDRDFGSNFMNRHGIKTPQTDVFTDFEKAKEHVRKTGKRYVFKPNGNLETDLTYVSSSADDMLRMLPYLESKCPEDVEFELQEFIDGVEMSTEAWFNGENFVHPINSTIEKKKFMAGGIGPNTGCMGNVMWHWPEDISQLLYRMLFEKMEPTLQEAGYVGPLDINAIWTKQGPYGLEFTARFGYDAIQAFSTTIEDQFSSFLYNFVHRREPISIPGNTDLYGASVRVSIPPFPNKGDVPQVPIGGNVGTDRGSIFLSDVYKADSGLFCSGYDGYVLSVARSSKMVSRALQSVYRIIDKLEIPQKQYRIDIEEGIASSSMGIRRYLESTLDASRQGMVG